MRIVTAKFTLGRNRTRKEEFQGAIRVTRVTFFVEVKTARSPANLKINVYFFSELDSTFTLS